MRGHAFMMSLSSFVEVFKGLAVHSNLIIIKIIFTPTDDHTRLQWARIPRALWELCLATREKSAHDTAKTRLCLLLRLIILQR